MQRFGAGGGVLRERGGIAHAFLPFRLCDYAGIVYAIGIFPKLSAVAFHVSIQNIGIGLSQIADCHYFQFFQCFNA